MTVNAKAPGKKSSEPPSKEEKVTVNEKSLTQKAKEGDEGMVPPTQKSKEGDEGMVKEEVVSHVHKHVRRTWPVSNSRCARRALPQHAR